MMHTGLRSLVHIPGSADDSDEMKELSLLDDTQQMLMINTTAECVSSVTAAEELSLLSGVFTRPASRIEIALAGTEVRLVHLVSPSG